MNITAGVIAALLLASTLASSQAQTAPPVRHSGKAVAVENLHYWETANSVRVIVDISGEAEFKQGDAKHPDRVFVDIRPAKLNPSLAGKQWPLKSNLLQQIRIGQYDNSTVRVVLHIGNGARVTSLALRDPDRLVIDMFPTESPSPPAVTSKTAAASIPAVASEASESAPASSALAGQDATALPTSSTSRPSSPPQISAKAAEAAAKPVTAAKAPKTGTRSLVRSLGLKLSRVVIDAGHGGHDTGTVGLNGYAEKDLVLDVAQRLKRLIEADIGAEVILTRNDDTFVPLETRTIVANQQEADLFLSIHANSSPVRSVRGVETYVLNFTTSREALDTASRENAASDRSIHELQDLVKKIMLQDKVNESRELARHIARALAARKGSGPNRGVKQAPFVVLIGANMPSVLAEICFISNPQEEKLVRNPATRQAIAESLLEGVRSYAESLSGTNSAKAQEKAN